MEMREEGKKTVFLPYQSQFLSRNHKFLDKNLAKNPRERDYWTPWALDKWEKYVKKTSDTCQDFHSSITGILAKPKKLTLENLQVLVDLRPVFEGVSNFN